MHFFAIFFIFCSLILSVPGFAGGGAKVTAVQGPIKASRIEGALQNEIAQRMKSEKLSAPAYFFVAFGYQGKGNLAKDSHTFASFVKVASGGEQTWSTISWLPADFDETRSICIFHDFAGAFIENIVGQDCTPVKAKNWDLNSTLRWAYEAKRTVGGWGPYRITRDFYELGLDRIQELRSGSLKYIADDRDYRSKDRTDAMNCMHAVSDLPGIYDDGGFLGGKYSYGIFGINGTKHVMGHLSRIKGLFLDSVDKNAYREIQP